MSNAPKMHRGEDAIDHAEWFDAPLYSAETIGDSHVITPEQARDLPRKARDKVLCFDGHAPTRTRDQNDDGSWCCTSWVFPRHVTAEQATAWLSLHAHVSEYYDGPGRGFAHRLSIDVDDNGVVTASQVSGLDI